MPHFKPIKQVRISEEVLGQLKEAILMGRFKSGEKLPSERELTAEFNVSRAVIREAVRALEQSGFLVIRQGPAGGAFVTDLTFDQVGNAFLDLFLANKLSIPELTQVRRYIEPEVARLAAKNISRASARLLLDAEEAEYIPDKSYPERMSKLTEVHHILAKICGNHFFEAVVKSLMNLTGEIVLAVDPDHKSLHGPGEHRKIVDAVIAGDADDAFSAMSQHLSRFSEALIKMEKAFRRQY